MLKRISKLLLGYKNTIMWALIILILCGMPPSGMPKIKIPGIDKVVHFGLFAVFTILVTSEANRYRTHLKISQRSLWLGFIISSVYGGLIELLQLWVFTSRGADWFDFVADLAGAAVAFAIYPFLNRFTQGYL